MLPLASDLTILLALSGMGVSTMSHESHLIDSPAMWYHSLLFLTRESLCVVVDSGDCSPRAQKSSSIAKSIVSHCFPRPAPVVLPSPEVTKSSVSHCFPNPPLLVLPTLVPETWLYGSFAFGQPPVNLKPPLVYPPVLYDVPLPRKVPPLKSPLGILPLNVHLGPLH